MTFPANAKAGDTYTFEDTVYTFNGSRWDRTVIGPANLSNYTNSVHTSALLSRIAHLEALIKNDFLIIE